MTFGSRQKGKRAERDVAEELQWWWSKLEPGCVFKPTPGSGGWSAKDARGDFGTAGDLVTTAKRWPFTVEIKHRESWSVDGFIAGKRSPVWTWWEQAKDQAREERRIPILLFRKNHETWRAMGPAASFELLGWEMKSRNSGDLVRVVPFDELLSTRPSEWSV